ncbi:ABC transporter permease,Macrolide export ATP-binding/permease protein MacB,macrolide transporter ATP-binding /permease protein,acidobacterial duplicated orphan permease,MacB-like periplasmic core domain [[Clostridium] sordellii]|uniref:ABC transporter permease n=1 Tax=Paraclostridium sordellii TaxID=1505 RepID=UPI0005420E63|nr:ABC transporter permease [Paeniclostridium sordellii]CEK33862.1 ABC transporter permease,Macrolide export ATP-binding/permease protein MacB,macrolide transporter ATP-binding /permease protein,acidobacterial duplicated orphan permease,MacB-like periplasmic core domain [[Clostridium] sordellii] [Paeniclostridium sordellii]
MNLVQIIKMSLQEIKSSKLRSFLTILGTAIGAASIILFVTISIGARQSMYKEVEAVSSEVVTANINTVDENKIIQREDINNLLSYQNIKEVSAVISGPASVLYNSKEIETNISGVDESYKPINKLKIKSGRFLNSIDLENYNNVAIIGSKVAKKIFQLEDPVGKYVNINSVPYKIVGVLEQVYDKYELPDDEKIYIPLMNAENILNTKGIATMFVKGSSVETIYDTTRDVEKFLIKKIGDKDEFYITSNQEIIDMSKSMNIILDIMVGAISSISLFVAGIGIMNMMLVSVTERTKEIGIRKALGAKEKTILTQFLVESLTISSIGGISGAILGILGSNIVLSIMGSDPYISWPVVIISILFSILMGVIFGVTPAKKAAKLKPIVALKSE